MRAAGVAGVSRRRGPRTTRRDVQVRPAPDRVERCFEADAPNRLWVADITYIPTLAGSPRPGRPGGDVPNTRRGSHHRAAGRRARVRRGGPRDELGRVLRAGAVRGGKGAAGAASGHILHDRHYAVAADGGRPMRSGIATGIIVVGLIFTIGCGAPAPGRSTIRNSRDGTGGTRTGGTRTRTRIRHWRVARKPIHESA